MPEIKFSKDLVQLARLMRESGASFREISEILGMSIPVIHYHCHDITPPSDGHNTILRSIDDILAAWAPAPPELVNFPIPNWLWSLMQTFKKQNQENKKE